MSKPNAKARKGKRAPEGWRHRPRPRKPPLVGKTPRGRSSITSARGVAGSDRPGYCSAIAICSRAWRSAIANAALASNANTAITFNS